MVTPGTADHKARPTKATEEPGRIDISCDNWPLVRVVYLGTITNEIMTKAAQRYADLAERAKAQGERLCWLINLDGFNASLIDAVKRRAAAEILKQYTPRIASGTRAEARVTKRSLARGVLIAVAWMAPQPWPIEIFATDAEGLAWLRRRSADG